MRILHARPERGLKTKLCHGDEADVSQLERGRVERLQKTPLNRSDLARFFIGDSDMDWQKFQAGSSQPEYHMLKFLSLALAHSLFPENVVNMRELRISRGPRGMVAAYYSDFVSDESGVIGRRNAAVERYYASESGCNDALRKAIDGEELKINPALGEQVAALRRAGLFMNHPEANYHLSKGNIVFFEVDGIEIGKALRAIGSDTEPLLLLSEIYAVATRAWLKNMSRKADDDLWQSGNMQKYEYLRLDELVSFFFHCLRIDDNVRAKMLSESHDLVKTDPEFWVSLMERTKRGNCPLNERKAPVQIEDDAFFLG